MRYAVFTDIHANLEALEAVLAKIDEIAAAEPIDQIWFLGDLVGYGPDPNECIRVLRERTDVIIAGNHDWAAVGKIDLEDFSAAARVSAEWTAEQLTPEYRDFLTELPERLELGDCTLVHGSPFGPLWEYLTSETLAERSFLYFDTHYCLVGHTHVPVIFIQSDAANIPTVPLAESEPAVRDLANGTGNHHEPAVEVSATDESIGAEVKAGAMDAAGETDDDETAELIMIPSQGQQSSLSAATQAETAPGAYQEPRDAASPAQQEALASTPPSPPEQEQHDEAASEGEPTTAVEPASTLDDDDETVSALSTAQGELLEKGNPASLNNGNEEDDEDDETAIAPLHGLTISHELSELAGGEREGHGGEDEDDATSIAGEAGTEMGIDDEDQAAREEDKEDEGKDEVNDKDKDEGRTPESVIESAEERLTNEIEELLNLLGLSQSMVQVTNQMLTPPEGHWEMPPDHRAIINPGGVGQPRDGDPRAAFMIYDTERGFEFYRVPYDFEKTQEKIINAGLPHFLAVRLGYGR